MSTATHGVRVHRIVEDFERAVMLGHDELKAMACAFFATGLWPTMSMALRDARAVLAEQPATAGNVATNSTQPHSQGSRS